MRTPLLILVSLLAGCGPPGLANKQNDTKVPLELDNVQNCFNSAVFLLQREPQVIAEMPAFLREAKRMVEDGGVPNRGNFKNLYWSTDGKTLLTSNGRIINCNIVSRSHDNYGPDGTAFLTTYCLTVEGTEHSNTFIVELSIRN